MDDNTYHEYPSVDPADSCRYEGTDGTVDFDEDIEEANRRLENRGITVTRLEDQHGAQRLSMEGWIILKVVPTSEITPVNKTFVYMQQGNSYPMSHGYTENEVTRTAMFVMGKSVQHEIERIRKILRETEGLLQHANKRNEELDKTSTWQKQQIENACQKTKIEEANSATLTQQVNQQIGRAVAAEKELAQLKAGLAKTFVRLADGQEATIPEVAEMQKTSDILMDDKPPF
jgi:hypothetical protein